MLELTSGVMFLMSSLYGPGHSYNHINMINTVNAESSTKVQATTTKTNILAGARRIDVENYLIQEYADTPILVEIARCESEFRHYGSDGNVLRGRVEPDDIGVMQINKFYHGDKAKEMGIDIYTIDGNIEFAKYLYKKYGNKPWSASAPCWSKPRELAKNNI